jgi:hypothetical protein
VLTSLDPKLGRYLPSSLGAFASTSCAPSQKKGWRECRANVGGRVLAHLALCTACLLGLASTAFMQDAGHTDTYCCQDTHHRLASFSWMIAMTGHGNQRLATAAISWAKTRGWTCKAMQLTVPLFQSV